MSDPHEQLRAGLSQRYTIERELGRGGMATVFLAQDLKHDRPVALKVLHPELAASLGPERFQREIRFAARLQHPHILTVLDSGDVNGQLWFTMPFVEGESLRDWIRRERQLPLEASLQVVREAARALDYAHQHGVIHRDIKPENIMLARDGTTLVADFGIARALVGGEQLTEPGVAIGTPAYMSPEQASGDKVIDARTDVYSLGCVLYEMLAGESPYTGPTAQAVIMKRFTDPVPSVRRLRPNVPEAVDQAIQRALSPIAADRHASPAEFVRALQVTGVYSPGTSTVGTPLAPTGNASPPAAKRESTPVHTSGLRRSPTLLATLVVGFLLGLGVLFAWRRSHSPAAGTGGAKVLAVLPFENLGDSTSEYFADGVTDAVRGKLSSLTGLQVIASRSSNEYKHSTKELTVIARELGADYLLIARVRWAKLSDGTSRVQVSPELVDASAGGLPRTKWQQSFDEAITNLFEVQADIASQVASALDMALASGQRRSFTEKPTQNLAAYDAFLKGEAAQGIIIASAPALRSSIGYYEQAVASDANFARAWGQLARAQAAYYFNVTPTLASAEAAKRAIGRVVALAPGRPETQLALGDFYLNVHSRDVHSDNERALAAYELGLKSAPEDADLLTQAALAEQGLGRWNDAFKHLERAQTLDPRSETTARRLVFTLLRLRRYPEALAAVNRARAAAPANLDLLEGKAMVFLAQGDLEGARAVFQGAAPEIEPAALVAFVSNYWDLYWVLGEEQQQLLLRLTPGAFGDDVGTWALILAQTYYLRGDMAKARIYADSARLAEEATLRVNPADAQRQTFLGLALAYEGRKAEAIREGQRAVAAQPTSADAYTGPYLQHQLAKIYLLTGEPERALDQLEPLLRMPYFLTPGWLRIDPTFAPLRGNPRFEKLVAGG